MKHAGSSGPTSREAGPIETPLSDASGGVLADPVLSDGDYPSGDRSTMDGYVIRADEAPGQLFA